MDQGNVYSVHSDHLGTPYLLTDNQGQRVWQADYESFGLAKVSTDSRIEFNIRFAGQYYDHETQTHYNYLETTTHIREDT